jgi:hypothetical protein
MDAAPTIRPTVQPNITSVRCSSICIINIRSAFQLHAYRVARDRAALAEALRHGPAARVADARDRQQHLLCHAGGLPVATAAERLAAVGDDLPLVGRLARRRAL